MRSTQTRPDVDRAELMLRGLSLQLRAQAGKVLRSVPDYDTAYELVAEARVAIEMIEQLLKRMLTGDDEDPDPDEQPGEVTYPEGMYL